MLSAIDKTVRADPALLRFRAAVASFYGGKLERVVLFGSRARGDFKPDSDYDVAVFLNEIDNFWDEVRRLADIATDILIDTGAVISAKPFSRRHLQRSLGAACCNPSRRPRPLSPTEHIERARHSLASARYLLTRRFIDKAGREAYLTAYHAALAFTVAHSDERPKTHGGTRSAFALLARDEASITRHHIGFLGWPTSSRRQPTMARTHRSLLRTPSAR